MSTMPLTAPGNLLQDLLGSWKKEFPKRASGGWWALSGFALQTSVYLLRFFQQVEKGVEPGLLAEMEHLSDILCPADGRLTLIQVKRTLTRHALISAVEEAYLITDLCRQKTPALINHLRFQIACSKRLTTTEVADLSMADVISSDGDIVSWNLMIRCFDEVAPITEEPDALDQLYTLLWNVGIKNTHALIERCVGKLLMNFGTSDPERTRQIGRELADYFFAAERHDKWEPVGSLLTTKDIMPDPMASEYFEVLTGQQPRLEHLMKGFFRDRPHIFQDLWETFTSWVSSLDHMKLEVNYKVPVFWVGGRSGEGKSVLLIQLVAEALRSSIVSPLLQLKAGDDLPRLVVSALDREQLTNRGFGRIFAVVDDLYDLHRHERDEWDAIILNECDYRSPPLAIITCGPTEQKEQFTARLSGPFEVRSFEVPPIDVKECRAFLNWYESRTGQSREWSELTTENALLVQLMFELAHGERMPEFARRFRKRLSDMEVFDAARAILAVNALYMDAPLSLLTTHESRDALEYLCRDEQLHFRVTLTGDEMSTAGVRLAHSHLAWLLFIEWVDPPPTTLAKAWGRELFKSLSIFEEMPAGQAASNLLNQLLHTMRLSDEGSPNSEPPTANRLDLIRELYRLHTRQNGHPSPRTLPRWLDLEYKIPGLRLTPDPAKFAVSCFSDAALVPHLHGSVASWVWLLSESRPLAEAEKTRTSVRDFLFGYPDLPGIGSALSRLLAKRRHDQSGKQLVTDWLLANPINPQALRVVVTLVAANTNDAAMRGLALNWLAANDSHPQAYQLIVSLVAGNPNDAELRELAASWLGANESHPQADWLIAVMVAGNPNDAKLRELALSWLGANESHPQAHQLIAALAAGNPNDAELRDLAVSWLGANDSHPHAYQLIAALVAGNPNDAELRELAVRWLGANDSHPHAYQLIAPLVAGTPDDAELRELAVSWLGANHSHAHAYQLIAPLVAGTPDDAELRELAVSWLGANESHPQAYHVIAALVAGNPNDAKLRELAVSWLGANESHAQAYHTIAALVAANPTDAQLRELAVSWLGANKSRPQAHQLIAPLVAGNPTDAELRELAVSWLAANESHPQAYQLIAPLVAGNPTDAELRELAVSWLGANASHQQAYQLIATLVAGSPMNVYVMNLAAAWLKTNEQHPQYHELLRVVIARSGGARTWLDRGENYIQKADSAHREAIHSVLVTASKADPKYIEMAFDFMESTAATVPRSSILYHLSRALVRNFDNAVQYLNGSYDEQRKKTVCASVASGMKRFPDTIATFALNVVNHIDSKYVAHVLWNVITRRLENDYLDEMILQWLVDNYRRRGYGGMLTALHQNADFWERLLRLGGLPKRIVDDFNAQVSA